MKKSTIVTIFVLIVTVLFAAAANAQVKTHSVWTNNNGAYVRDATNGCLYTTFSGFNMATSWTEPTAPPTADSHFRGVTKAVGYSFSCITREYDFRQVVVATRTASQIDGQWDVYRNGVQMCASCNGSAYGMNGAAGAGNYYKLYVDDPFWGPQMWLYSGYIDQRKDF